MMIPIDTITKMLRPYVESTIQRTIVDLIKAGNDKLKKK